MDENQALRKVIANLELQLANSHKMRDMVWNSAVKASMDQFGVEHKPRCTRSFCQSCNVRHALAPLLRSENLNRMAPRELIGGFISAMEGDTKHIGKERKAYLQGLHDLFEEMIKKGLV